MNEIRRYDNDEGLMIRDSYGKWVDFTDHERVAGDIESCHNATIETVHRLTQSIHDLRTDLAASHAEVDGLKKDAERWRHARQLLTLDDIFNRQRELEGWQNLVSEEECERADKAIDTAMEKGNV